MSTRDTKTAVKSKGSGKAQGAGAPGGTSASRGRGSGAVSKGGVPPRVGRGGVRPAGTPKGAAKGKGRGSQPEPTEEESSEMPAKQRRQAKPTTRYHAEATVPEMASEALARPRGARQKLVPIAEIFKGAELPKKAELKSAMVEDYLIREPKKYTFIIPQATPSQLSLMRYSDFLAMKVSPVIVDLMITWLGRARMLLRDDHYVSETERIYDRLEKVKAELADHVEEGRNPWIRLAAMLDPQWNGDITDMVYSQGNPEAMDAMNKRLTFRGRPAMPGESENVNVPVLVEFARQSSTSAIAFAGNAIQLVSSNPYALPQEWEPIASYLVYSNEVIPLRDIEIILSEGGAMWVDGVTKIPYEKLVVWMPDAPNHVVVTVLGKTRPDAAHGGLDRLVQTVAAIEDQSVSSWVTIASWPIPLLPVVQVLRRAYGDLLERARAIERERPGSIDSLGALMVAASGFALPMTNTGKLWRMSHWPLKTDALIATVNDFLRIASRYKTANAVMVRQMMRMAYIGLLLAEQVTHKRLPFSITGLTDGLRNLEATDAKLIEFLLRRDPATKELEQVTHDSIVVMLWELAQQTSSSWDTS